MQVEVSYRIQVAHTATVKANNTATQAHYITEAETTLTHRQRFSALHAEINITHCMRMAYPKGYGP